MKKTLLLIVILFSTISCDLGDNEDCYTPPRQFNFDLVDATTLENLFLDEAFTEEALKIYDDTDTEVNFELVFYNEKYILSLYQIGWELEPKTYTIELSPEISVVFKLDMDQVTSDSCTYFEVATFEVEDYEYEEDDTTGIIQVKIDLN
ncbi:hypothetical protein MKD41_04265 [Lutibacter sp. A64]|uniref:hypothetical protein n=1 Tax=Lutibacter sp. A64 TaxID=2918526 RepID=UPI001F05C8EB|nr:hypothetical protein [Lutibacter sp. A64]UMB54687.1 hypothetical protein MKD41_04265 [Lutibacter sp. A64]